MIRKRGLVVIPAVMGVFLFGASRDARGVPSYARQTGMACNLCHRAFPELTRFGRNFKASGYTLTQIKELQESGADTAPLEINDVLPLSLMFQASFTRTDQAQPDTQNNDIEFPQQMSLFLAGEITPHIGSFMQVTYTQVDDHITMDNTDVRFADRTTLCGKDMVYGATVNNNPTLEDLWNSTPAWGYPYASADSVPTPSAGALIDGALAQEVFGVGGYGFWNQHLYLATAVYRSAQIGGSQPPTSASGDTIDDVAPYWRLAWQGKTQRGSYEVGTYGLFAKLYPDSVSGKVDKYTDAAFDFQVEHELGEDLLLFHGTYIYEHQDPGATHAAGGSSNSSNDLHTFRVDGNYYLGGHAVFTLAGFLIRGDSDSLLYEDDDPLQNSANGSPDSDGLIAQVSYYPWQNVRFSAQYTAYFQFNGAGSDYNGAGRDASDNNTLYALLWLVF